VGGSPLANDAKQQQADILRHWPKDNCDSGDLPAFFGPL
jgi:hypothetical protein